MSTGTSDPLVDAAGVLLKMQQRSQQYNRDICDSIRDLLFSSSTLGWNPASAYSLSVKYLVDAAKRTADQNHGCVHNDYLPVAAGLSVSWTQTLRTFGDSELQASLTYGQIRGALDQPTVATLRDAFDDFWPQESLIQPFLEPMSSGNSVTNVSLRWRLASELERANNLVESSRHALSAARGTTGTDQTLNEAWMQVNRTWTTAHRLSRDLAAYTNGRGPVHAQELVTGVAEAVRRAGVLSDEWQRISALKAKAASQNS